jgi:hypothetical protein
VGKDYGQLAYNDEMGLHGLGRGYLGEPLTQRVSWAALQAPFHDGLGSVAAEVFRRDFENGIVLLNSGTTPRIVSVDRRYRNAWTGRGTVWNNRSLTTLVSIPARDGLVLVSR